MLFNRIVWKDIKGMPPLSPRKKSCLALAIAQSLNLAAAQAATIEVLLPMQAVIKAMVAL